MVVVISTVLVALCMTSRSFSHCDCLHAEIALGRALGGILYSQGQWLVQACARSCVVYVLAIFFETDFMLGGALWLQSHLGEPWGGEFCTSQGQWQVALAAVASLR